jgi:PAS domain S-box-containing protein
MFKKNSPTTLALGLATIAALIVILIYVGHQHITRLHAVYQAHIITAEKTKLASTMRDAVRKRSFSLALAQTMGDFFDRDAEEQRFRGYAREFILAQIRLRELGLSAKEQALLKVFQKKVRVGQNFVDNTMSGVVKGLEGAEFERLMKQTIQHQSAQFSDLEAFVDLLKQIEKDEIEKINSENSRENFQAYLIAGFLILMSLVIGIVIIIRERQRITGLNEEISSREKSETDAKNLNLILEEKVLERTKDLRESEARIKAIFEAPVDAMITIDQGGVIQSFNQVAERIFGYIEEKAVSQNIEILIPGIFDADHDDYLQNYLRTGETAEIGRIVEIEGRRKDGNLFPIEIAMNKITVGGEVLFKLIVRDISVRKMAEEEQRVSTDRYRMFADAGGDRFWETDAQHNHTFVTPPVGDLNIPTENFIGNPPWNIMRRDRKEGWDELKALMENHEPINDFRYTSGYLEGELHHIRLSGRPTFDSAGNFKGYRGVINNETDEVNAREKANLIQQSLFDSLDEIKAGVVLFDADHRFVSSNNYFRTTRAAIADYLVPGTHMDEILRAIAEMKIIKQSIGRTADWLTEKYNENAADSSSDEYQISDGRWFRFNKLALKDGGRLTFHLDISEIKQREEEYLEAKIEAETANNAKSNFLSSMSHELRTPMNAVLGFAQMLEFNKNEPLTETQSQYIKHILMSGDHLLNLIEDVLELNQIEAGQLSLIMGPVPAKKVLEESLSQVEFRAEESRIDIINLAEGVDLPILWTDLTRLKQVFLNLLANAVKYNREGGSITVSCEDNPNGTLRIKVADTGQGIPEDKANDLFVPFERLGRESGKIEGTGIGLSIAKQIIEALGGQIGFMSEGNKGTTFWVDVPIYNAERHDGKSEGRAPEFTM